MDPHEFITNAQVKVFLSEKLCVIEYSLIVQSPQEVGSSFTFVSRPANCVQLSSLPAWSQG